MMSSAVHPGFALLVNALYTILWCIVGPWLFLSPRLRHGWRERVGLTLPGRADIWIQGASAGECALVAPLLERLPGISVLATTCTAQGLEVLQKSLGPSLQTAMLPLDVPILMRRMLDTVRPKVMVLLETEIWPGLLLACASRKVPVVILNARMTSRSLAGYLWLAPLLRLCPPARIGAISPSDALRFDIVFGSGLTRVCGNIKFDRALEAPLLNRAANPLASLFPENTPVYVLGSVREEEETCVISLLLMLLDGNPQAIIGLFPRHMHRLESWSRHLASAKIRFCLRSELNNPAEMGSVVLWDRFGELGHAYGLASGAFVGGSLARLGGQNFLEPLAQGCPVVVGPYTKNFDWVGQEIFHTLVSKNADIRILAQTILGPRPPRIELRKKALEYIRPRQGATDLHAHLITAHLSRKTDA